MKTNISTFLSIYVSLAMLLSCNQNTEKEAFNYAQFDYIANFYFNKSKTECEQSLPNDKTLVDDNGAGFVYEFGSNNLVHRVKITFNGREFFEDALFEIDFSKYPEHLEASFLYISKMLEESRGAAAFHDVTDGEELLVWTEETMEDFLYLIKLSKIGQMISIHFYEQPVDYGGVDLGGEWVQRGENGEWVFVPD